jgi:DNA-binding MarR family transcriptional regulator
MDTNNLIHTLLQHLSAVFARESDQILQEQLGIGFSQYKILVALRGNPTIQQRQIAVSLGQTEASISRQIKFLQKKSMLTSRVDPRNRRAHIVALTARGERIAEAAQNVLRNYQQGALEHMNAQRQAQLVELLAEVHS